MDLIYTNASREDMGVLQDCTLDLAYGSGENDFELTTVTSRNVCAPGCLIYAEGTEYGGIVDRMDVKTADGTLVYAGRTWHGVLEGKILAPDKGEDYLTLSGDANRVLERLIARCGLTDLFQADPADSGIVLGSYRMDRYIPAYTGIVKMLSRAGAKLRLRYSAGKVTLSAAARVLYDEDTQAGPLADFDLSRTERKVNHLVCLGAGELAARIVAHLYADGDGAISQTQTFAGADEVAEVYENTNDETEADLLADAAVRFRELRDVDRIEMSLAAAGAAYDVGDQIRAAEQVTGLTVTQTVKKKIVTIRGGEASITCEIGGKIT